MSSYFGHKCDIPLLFITVKIGHWEDNLMPCSIPNIYKNSLGRTSRSPLWWWWKMTAVPLPHAILDDPISVSAKFDEITSAGSGLTGNGNGVIQDCVWKRNCRHFPPPPHWGSKSSAHVLNDVCRTSTLLWKRPTDVCLPMTHHDLITHVSQGVQHSEIRSDHVWFILLAFGKHLIFSLTQALSKWLIELPACYYADVISLHMSKVVKTFDFSKLLL